MPLKRGRFHTSLCELLGRAGCGRETFDMVSLRHCGFANHGEGRGFSGAGNTVQANDLLTRTKDVVDDAPLADTEFRVPIFDPDPHLGRDQGGISKAAPVAFLHPGNGFPFQPNHLIGCELQVCAALCNFTEFARPHPTLELTLNGGMRGFSHATCKGGFKDRPTVLHSRSLKDMSPRPGHGPLRVRLRFPHLTLPVRPRLGHNAIGLVPILGSQFTVPAQHFVLRQQLLLVAGMMSRDLRGRRSVDSLLAQMVLDLFPARAGCVQILLCVSPDFRLPVLSAFDLIPEIFKARREFGSVHRGDVSLRDEDLVRLQGARLSVLALRDIEDDSVGMQLRRRVTVNGAGGVMLEGRSDKLACCFRRVNVPQACLREPLQFRQGHSRALPVGQSNPVVTAHKRGNRYGLRRGERGVPTGAVVNAGDFSAVLAFIASRNLVPDELRPGPGMLAF